MVVTLGVGGEENFDLRRMIDSFKDALTSPPAAVAGKGIGKSTGRDTKMTTNSNDIGHEGIGKYSAVIFDTVDGRPFFWGKESLGGVSVPSFLAGKRLKTARCKV